jgi:hypothetical protein
MNTKEAWACLWCCLLVAILASGIFYWAEKKNLLKPTPIATVKTNHPTTTLYRFTGEKVALPGCQGVITGFVITDGEKTFVITEDDLIRQYGDGYALSEYKYLTKSELGFFQPVMGQ